MAIHRTKVRKAPGPDQVSNEMLKHLGISARTVLLKFFNMTWRDGSLPQAWKTAIVTPIPKKGKDPSEPQSYRPISLTSCVGKIAERIVNARLYDCLERKGILTEAHAGFRRGRQPIDQILIGSTGGSAERNGRVVARFGPNEEELLYARKQTPECGRVENSPESTPVGRAVIAEDPTAFTRQNSA